MRVIAGKFRSRKLDVPAGTAIRPTSDRLRETLFNVLGPRIPGCRFLDLYAGTGAVGIEAISRGAQFVSFVESEKKAARSIRDNLASLGVREGHELIEQAAVPALRIFEANVQSFDICFLDPPYDSHGAYEQALSLLAASKMLTQAGIAVAEHDKHFDPGGEFGQLQRYRELKQGDAVLSFYRIAHSA